MYSHGGRMWVAKRRAKLALPVWLFCSGWFWVWWLQQAPKTSLPIYIPLTCALIYETTVVPGALLFLTLKAKLPARRRAPKGKKVAVITLCVPSQESMAVVERQLKAMSEISYPHDSWILDEGNSQIIKNLAKEYGVKHFSRKNIKKYNKSTFPFQAGTKAGNVNAWLDYARARKYEFFVQLDIDHVPTPQYLDKTLGHFRDPDIAWVQSPSVYANTKYWTARGSAEQEMGLNGPMQMGYYGWNKLPLIVGSHAAYRASAISEIGGFQPTRAEDQLNTLVLASKGWRGVFVPEVLALGDGPETLQGYLTQQYAWARSIMQLLKNYSFEYFNKLTKKQILQFSFLQSWYPLSTLSFLILYFVPVISLLFDLHVVNLNVKDLVEFILPFLLALIMILWSAKPLMQPQELKISWRGILLHLVRWPTILRGIASALANRKKPYQVTPKGRFLNRAPTLKLYRSFLLFGCISALAAIFSAIVRIDKLTGQVIFAIYDATIMLSVCLIDIFIRLKQTRVKFSVFLRLWLKPIGAIATAMLIIVFGIADNFVAPLKTSLALAPKAAYVQTLPNLNLMPIDKLNDAQLDEQIAAKQYKINPNTQAPSLGIYSPVVPVHSKGPYINSIFMDWRQNWMLAQGLVASNRTGATSLVTIEPKGDSNGARLLSNIAAGAYDNRLMTIFNTIKLDPNTVYVRFAQEMDLPNSFNWGAQDPSIYIAAYQHVVNLARSHNVSNVKWVWSPAGLPSAASYYPGDQYVDVVGTTMLYDPFWSGNYHPTFSQIQAVRSWLLSYNKPVWITEFGVGDENTSFQTQLIQSALAEYKADGYQAIVYLNIIDPNVKGPNYSLNNVSVLDNMFNQTPFQSNQPSKSTRLALKPKTKNTNNHRESMHFSIVMLTVHKPKYLQPIKNKNTIQKSASKPKLAPAIARYKRVINVTVKKSKAPSIPSLIQIINSNKDDYLNIKNPKGTLSSPKKSLAAKSKRIKKSKTSGTYNQIQLINSKIEYPGLKQLNLSEDKYLN